MAKREGLPARRAVILTALEVEYRAVRGHLRDVREVRHPRCTIYECGRFGRRGVNWEVAIVEIGTGNAGAAVETERAIGYFNPEVMLFVGVAGGIKDVAIGDVVSATKVYNYASGKALKDFQTRPDLVPAAYELEQQARAERRRGGWLRRLGAAPPDPRPRVVVAPIAAGEQVVASKQSATWKLIRKHYGDAVAVEMEGSGFLKAAHANAQAKALVIRGISDLIEDKSAADASGSQERAARHAAAFAFELLAQLPAEEVPSPPPPESKESTHQAPSAPPAAAMSAPYGPPIKKTERLVSNLLPVTAFAPKLYIGATELRQRSDVWKTFEEANKTSCPSEFILKEKRIISFHDLSQASWGGVCELGSVETFDTAEWAFSPDQERRHEFVQLLYRALEQKLYPVVRKWRDLDVFAFRPRKGHVPPQVRIGRLTVFKRYMKQSKGVTYTHYRHHAFEGHYKHYEGQWYLEVTPTYLFTEDGFVVHRFHEDWLSGIKRMEKNRAVISNLLMWAEYLGRSGDLVNVGYPYLSFGRLPEVTLEVGIPDDEWLVHDESAGYEGTDELFQPDASAA